jgi:predicted TIM-barrel fold metal-dependent hydrolase
MPLSCYHSAFRVRLNEQIRDMLVAKMLDWRFIDCNAMIGNTLVPPPAPLLTGDALLREMDRFGIEQALFYHNDISKETINQRTLETAKMSRRLIPCWALPIAPVGLDERLELHVDEMLEAGVKAVRFVQDFGPSAPPLTLRVWELEKTYEKLNRHRVPVLLDAEHFETPLAASTYGWDQVEEICHIFPEMPLVLLQLRYAAQAPLIAAMRRHKNLYFTIPWLGLFRQVEGLVKMFGPQRAIFGTNLPYIDPALPVGMVNFGLFTLEQKKLIAGDNLRRLLGGVR